MKQFIKKTINGVLAPFNLKVCRVSPNIFTGVDLFSDLRFLIDAESPVCLDIGANTGQTIDNLLRTFRDPYIYAFEPSKSTFYLLSSRGYTDRVFLYNFALGRERKELEFINYERSCLSSFLPLSLNEENYYRKVAKSNKEIVRLETVDYFLNQNKIKKVDLLKTDTQGYDLEVLSGAMNALDRGIIRYILVEINFVKMYEGQASPDELISLLREKNYYLIDYYEKVRQGYTLAWCTALFGRRY